MKKKSTSNNAPQLPQTVNTRGRAGRLIRWENGRPVPVYAPPLRKEQVSELLTAALSLEYTGDVNPDTGKVTNIDERFIGMTNVEVLAVRLAERAASGSDKAVTELLDRILGKPKQSHETVGVRMTYQDYLSKLEEEDDKDLNEMTQSGLTPNTVDVSFWDDDLDEEDDYDLSDIFGD